MESADMDGSRITNIVTAPVLQLAAGYSTQHPLQNRFITDDDIPLLPILIEAEAAPPPEHQ